MKSMKIFWFVVSAFLLLSVSCTEKKQAEEKELSSRDPAGVESAFHSVKRLTVDNVGNVLGNTTEFVTKETAQALGVVYISTLPIPAEIKDFRLRC